MSYIARLVAVPAIVGGIALGMVATAHAAPAPVAPTPVAPGPVGPGYQYYPEHYAPPAPTQIPGWQHHHGPNHMH